MTYTSYQLEILVIGLVAFALEFSSGTLLARGLYLGSGVAVVLSIIAWTVTYRITAGRSRRA
jgi:Na+-transporting methylmalonyl-CoA/oxaloacetate decarboxylase beta subunit